MREPKISVIVPVYNAENTIEKCVASICNQTYSELEIILVNDGSQDKSLEIISKISLNDERIIVIDKKNSGVSDTRNTGIMASTGEFIAFVDSDDFVDDDLYKNLIQCAVAQQTELVALLNYTIFPNIIPNEVKLLSSEKAQEELLRLRFPTSCWAYLYSKNIVKNKFFDVKIGFFEDLLFNFNVLQSISRVGLFRKDMYHYITNDSSINQSALNEKKMSVLDIHIDEADCSKNFYNAVTFFKAHTVVSLLISAMRNGNNGIQNFDKLKRFSRNLLKRNYVCFSIPPHYLVMVAVTCFSPKFAVKIGKKLYITYKGEKND